MKKIVLVAVAAFAASVIAVEKAAKPVAVGPTLANAAAANAPALTDAEKAARKAAAQKRMLERTGGMVEMPGTGKLVIVNCQKKVPAEVLQAKVDQFIKFLHVKIELVEGSWRLGTPVPGDANAALFVVDDPALPISLIAPEAQWGALNVANLDADARFRKAFTRAAVSTFGAGVSQIKGSAMQTVKKVEDLDKLHSDSFGFDSLSCIMRNLENLGVTQTKKSSYRKACIDGWAPQPTNDYQKAVWEEIHAKPTKPMTIKYDPKKGE